MAGTSTTKPTKVVNLRIDLSPLKCPESYCNDTPKGDTGLYLGPRQAFAVDSSVTHERFRRRATGNRSFEAEASPSEARILGRSQGHRHFGGDRPSQLKPLGSPSRHAGGRAVVDIDLAEQAARIRRANVLLHQ